MSTEAARPPFKYDQGAETIDVLIFSQVFAPSIGGLETVGENLASGLARRGHRITVVTRTPASGEIHRPYEVLRNPTPLMLARRARRADVILHNNLMARLLWASLLTRRPTLVAHHTWLISSDFAPGYKARLKTLLIRRFANVAVSQTLAENLPTSTRVIPNGCDTSTFKVRRAERGVEPIGFLFVGRLVSDKGCDLLIDAFEDALSQGLLGEHGYLTIIGTGPEKTNLAAQVKALNLSGKVRLVGAKAYSEVAELMQVHRVLAVPSRWREPFGLVGLEAAAAGCTVVVPDSTGLIEAAGPAAVPFRRNDAKDLARALVDALRYTPGDLAVQAHVEAHTMERQVAAYERALLEISVAALAGPHRREQLRLHPSQPAALRRKGGSRSSNPPEQL